MAFIPTIDESEATGKLEALYQRGRDPKSGRVDNVLKIHSLHPDGLAAHLAVYTTAMRGTRSLRKVDRELIAFVVSKINHCHY